MSFIQVSCGNADAAARMADGCVCMCFASFLSVLGVILHEMIGGSLPWGGRNVEALYHQILEADPPPLRMLDRFVPRDLETIVLKALEKEPARRYQTAEALALDLECFLHSEPISARPTGVWRLAGGAARRHPAFSAAVLVLLSVLLAMGSWAFLLRPAELTVTCMAGASLDMWDPQERPLPRASFAQDGTKSLQVGPGSYRLRCSLEKHVPEEKTVVLRRGHNPTLNFSLAQDEGLLRIESAEEGLKVHICAANPGKPEPQANTFDPPTETSLPSGEYIVTTFSERNWHTRQAVTVNRGGTTRVLAYAPPVKILWSFDAGPAGAYCPLRVALNGGQSTALITGGEGIHWLEGRTGRGLFNFPTRGLVYAKPLALDLDEDGVLELVAASWQEGVYCYRLAPQQPASSAMETKPAPGPLWVFPLPHGHRVKAALKAISGTAGGIQVIVADDKGEVRSIDAGGHLRWEIHLPRGIESQDALEVIKSPSCGLQELAVGTTDGNIYWLEPQASSMRIRGATPVGDGTAISGMLRCDLEHDGDLELLVGSGRGEVTCIHPDGSVKWRTHQLQKPPREAGKIPSLDAVVGAPAVFDTDGDGNEEVVVASALGVVSCLDSKGSLLWSKDVEVELSTGPAAGPIGPARVPTIVVAGEDQKLYGLRGQDGELSWSFLNGSEIVAKPHLADLDGDGGEEVLAGGRDGQLFALSGEVSRACCWLDGSIYLSGCGSVYLSAIASTTSSPPPSIHRPAARSKRSTSPYRRSSSIASSSATTSTPKSRSAAGSTSSTVQRTGRGFSARPFSRPAASHGHGPRRSQRQLPQRRP